jgi:hypothetical protein
MTHHLHTKQQLEIKAEKGSFLRSKPVKRNINKISISGAQVNYIG